MYIESEILHCRSYPRDFSIMFISTVHNISALLKSTTCKQFNLNAYRYYVGIAHDIFNCSVENRNDIESFWYGLQQHYVLYLPAITNPRQYREIIYRLRYHTSDNTKLDPRILGSLSLLFHNFVVTNPTVDMFHDVLRTLQSSLAPFGEPILSNTLLHVLYLVVDPNMRSWFPSHILDNLKTRVPSTITIVDPLYHYAAFDTASLVADINKDHNHINNSFRLLGSHEQGSLLSVAVIYGNVSGVHYLLDQGATILGLDLENASKYGYSNILDDLIAHRKYYLETLHFNVWENVLNRECAAVLLKYRLMRDDTWISLARSIVSDRNAYRSLLSFYSENIQQQQLHRPDAYIDLSVIYRGKHPIYLASTLYLFPSTRTMTSEYNRNKIHMLVRNYDLRGLEVVLQDIDMLLHINDRDELGNTPLHYCVVQEREGQQCKPAIATLLLNAGASPLISNYRNETPADLALHCDKPTLMYDLMNSF